MNTTLIRLVVSTLALVSIGVRGAEPYGAPVNPHETKPAPAAKAKAKPKPQFQFDSGDIRISIPTADESKAASFGAESIRAAAQYLDICLLRESGTPASDTRLRRGIAWLKREQRVSGRWWMHSLYRGNYHFSTYIATAKAMQALAMCGEIPNVKP